MSPKELVISFYQSDFYKDKTLLKSYLHPDCELNWSSSTGFVHFNHDEILSHGERAFQSFKELRAEITHVIAEENMVTIRYTYYVVTFDHPEEEICLAHFVSIWEVKDGKLYKGHEMSQLADESAIEKKAFLPIKF